MSALQRQRTWRTRRIWRAAVWLLAAVIGPLSVYVWNSPLWPGREEATATPQACDVVDGAAIDGLVANASDPTSDAAGTAFGDMTVCSWESPENHFPWQTLTVQITRERRSWSMSAADRADDVMRARRERHGADAADGGVFEPVDGVGDDAWVGLRADRSSTDVQAFGRRANVWVHVDYKVVKVTSDGADDAAVRASVVDVASTALREVRAD